MSITVGALFVAALLGGAASGQSPEPERKFAVLMVTQSKGFVHGVVRRKDPATLAPAEAVVAEIARTSGLFDVECTQDASVLTPEKLRTVDLVLFYTSGDLPISPENFAAFLQWLKGGKAFVGVHAATDTFKNFKPYYELINGTFNGHPWGAGETVTVTNHEPDHPVTRMWGAEFQIKDEIYQYRNYDPKAVRVLYSLNMAKCRTKMPYHVPICWVREVGKGRLFYTNLGHNESTWQNPTFKEHLLAGIRWALGLEKGSAAPNPELQALEEVKAFLAVAGPEAGKDAGDLLGRFERAPAAARAQLAAMVPALAPFRHIDPKKEPEKRAAEAARLVGDVERLLPR